MGHQSARIILIFLIILFNLGNSLRVMAQRPPTGGAAPIDDDSGVSPAIFIVGGVVIGAGTFAIVKTRGVLLPVAEYLPDYLLKHNILPNEDAVELMYSINPALNDNLEIRSKKKLDLPQFPKLDQSLIQELSNYSTGKDSSDLKDQLKFFEANKETFEIIQLENKGTETQVNKEKVSSLINQFEQNLTSSGESNEGPASVTSELINDLLNAFNQTLEEINSTKKINPEQVDFLEEIAESLSELVNDLQAITQNSQYFNFIRNWNTLDHNKFLASTSNNSNNKTITGFSSSIKPKTFREGNTMKFALAVYKFNKDGELITEGPEVEGKYIIRYVLPALKDYENAYHTIRNPATYAVGVFPPAKMYLVVEDENGNRMEIQYPIVDFKMAFESKQLVNENKLIVVPLKIKP